MPSESTQLEQAADIIVGADRVAILTGAGISKESGIPTFRDAQTGMWANYNPEDLATREGFLNDPTMVWEWYDFRRNKVWDVQPNPGHEALVDLENLLQKQNKHFALITQNIDNLHRQAGSERVLELHGNIFRYKCLEQDHPVALDDFKDSDESPPRCVICNSYVRPDVVWFGEALPQTILDQAFQESAQADVMIVVGTSGVVHPAAGLPMITHRHGSPVIEVNPEESALTSMVDIFLQGPSGIMLPELMRQIFAKV